MDYCKGFPVGELAVLIGSNISSNLNIHGVKITIPKSDFMQAVNSTIDHLNVWVRNQLDDYWKSNGYDSRLDYLWSPDNKGLFDNMVKVSCYNLNTLSIGIMCGELGANYITLHTKNTSDDSGLELVFSVEKFSKSDDVLNVVKNACKSFGEVYYVVKESDEDE